MTDRSPRNVRMAERIAAVPVRRPFSFVVAGDSGAWPDPTADAIFAQLLRQIAALRPAPVFFANLGDFAGPGTADRHRHYLELVAGLPVPNVCLIGNHDLEDAGAADAWSAVHGPRDFHFACGDTRFVAIDGASGQVGALGDTRPPDTAGPSARDGIRFVMSGGGGAALYLSYCDAGPDRGALFHAVEITLTEAGGVAGRVLQAFATPDSPPPFTFGDDPPGRSAPT